MVYIVYAFVFIAALSVRAARAVLQKRWLDMDSQVCIRGVIEFCPDIWLMELKESARRTVRKVGFLVDFRNRNLKNTRLGCYHFTDF